MATLRRHGRRQSAAFNGAKITSYREGKVFAIGAARATSRAQARPVVDAGRALEENKIKSAADACAAPSARPTAGGELKQLNPRRFLVVHREAFPFVRTCGVDRIPNPRRVAASCGNSTSPLLDTTSCAPGDRNKAPGRRR